MYVPNVLAVKNWLVDELHNTASHPEQERSYSVIMRTFYWPKLRKYVKYFVKLCSKCQGIKSCTDKPYGSSMPLPVPT